MTLFLWTLFHFLLKNEQPTTTFLWFHRCSFILYDAKFLRADCRIYSVSWQNQPHHRHVCYITEIFPRVILNFTCWHVHLLPVTLVVSCVRCKCPKRFHIMEWQHVLVHTGRSNIEPSTALFFCGLCETDTGGPLMNTLHLVWLVGFSCFQNHLLNYILSIELLPQTGWSQQVLDGNILLVVLYSQVSSRLLFLTIFKMVVVHFPQVRSPSVALVSLLTLDLSPPVPYLQESRFPVGQAKPQNEGCLLVNDLHYPVRHVGFPLRRRQWSSDVILFITWPLTQRHLPIAFGVASISFFSKHQHLLLFCTRKSKSSGFLFNTDIWVPSFFKMPMWSIWNSSHGLIDAGVPSYPQQKHCCRGTTGTGLFWHFPNSNTIQLKYFSVPHVRPPLLFMWPLSVILETEVWTFTSQLRELK